MAQQTTNESSGMGVVLGILLAVVIAIGAYFFLTGGNSPDSLEPAAGTMASAPGDQTGTMDTPDTATSPTPAPGTPAQ